MWAILSFHLQKLNKIYITFSLHFQHYIDLNILMFTHLVKVNLMFNFPSSLLLIPANLLPHHAHAPKLQSQPFTFPLRFSLQYHIFCFCVCFCCLCCFVFPYEYWWIFGKQYSYFFIFHFFFVFLFFHFLFIFVLLSIWTLVIFLVIYHEASAAKYTI